jgi:O-antigen/teichoic acid export membrane protein
VLSLYDAILAKRWFAPDTAGLYAAAAVVGRATYSTVAFIPAIVLPRVVHLTSGRRSTARVLALSLAATAAPMLVATAAVALLPHLVMAVMAGPSFAAAAPYALPLVLAAGSLALTNLGATYLVARRHFAAVPWLLAAGVAEIARVSFAHASLAQVAWTVCAGHAATLLITGAALLASRERRGLGE